MSINLYRDYIVIAKRDLQQLMYNTAYEYSCDQSNQSYDLHYDLQNWYDWPTVTADDRDLKACDKQAAVIHTTLQPSYRPEASSSRRQHHAREAAYPRVSELTIHRRG